MSAPAPTAFDPWVASIEDATRATASDPAALAKRTVAREVLDAQDACLKFNGGCAVMRAMSLCMSNDLMPPRWLRDRFAAMYSRVGDAEVGSWDEAIGAPFPPRTRLHDVKEHRRLRRVIHEAVFRAVTEEGAAVNKALFAQIGRRRDVCKSATTVGERYAEALDEGRPNPVDVRKAMKRSASAESLSRAFDSWAGIDHAACESGASTNH